jgi:hypothetical protein
MGRSCGTHWGEEECIQAFGGEVRLKKTTRVVRRRGSHIFLDNRLTDGDEVVSLTRRPPFAPRKIPDTHFC